MALTADRNTPARTGEVVEHPVEANVKIFAGALVALNAAGFAVPGSTSTTLKAVGRAEEFVDNTGGAQGAKTVRIARRGPFRFRNFATDAVVRGDIGNDCYIVDDEQVAKTNGANTRSVAGKVIDLDAQGVWVEIR